MREKEVLLDVENLNVAFYYERLLTQVIFGVSFQVNKGEVLGIVGESGCGKSVTVKSIIKILPFLHAEIQSRKILFEGRDIVSLSQKEFLDIRGKKISMIFQDPMTSLNPVFTCGNQIMEAISIHNKSLSKKEVYEKSIKMLHKVNIPNPELSHRLYPHELSGGMKQRVMIAIALSCNPSMLIADEPTTALDPTIQAQIIDLIKQLKYEFSTSVIYITHNLGVAAEICDRIIVMYAGQIIEQAPIQEFFTNPTHPYSKGLMKAMPHMEEKKERLNIIPGNVPSFFHLPNGCRFHPRCPYRQTRCTEEMPELSTVAEEHFCRCHFQGAKNE